MVYIDFISDEKEFLKEKENNLYSLLKKLLIFYRKRTNYISINKSEFGEIIKISQFNSILYNKLKKVLEINSVKTVCLSEKLKKNEKIYQILKEKNIKLINGNQLKKYLLNELIEYICNNKNESLHEQEVSFFIKKNNFFINSSIVNISEKVKNINIITTNPMQFRILEKKLYEEKGIILNITNNYKKSLLKSNFIINIDYFNEEIKKYNIPKFCCLINLFDEKITIDKKSFEGININDFKYIVSEKYVKNKLKNFDNEIFYESIIMRNSNPQNILNKIKNDKVKVVEVYGKNGIISKKEFEKLKRKLIL